MRRPVTGDRPACSAGRVPSNSPAADGRRPAAAGSRATRHEVNNHDLGSHRLDVPRRPPPVRSVRTTAVTRQPGAGMRERAAPGSSHVRRMLAPSRHCEWPGHPHRRCFARRRLAPGQFPRRLRPPEPPWTPAPRSRAWPTKHDLPQHGSRDGQRGHGSRDQCSRAASVAAARPRLGHPRFPAQGPRAALPHADRSRCRREAIPGSRAARRPSTRRDLPVATAILDMAAIRKALAAMGLARTRALTPT